MTKLNHAITLIAVCLLVLSAAAAAHAQAPRTWVSGVGDDMNPCSRTAPCKTFAGAFSKTATCGEISVLDPGGYGAVTITKAITINGGGELAGILASSGSGIIVNAGTGNVILKNLDIDGQCAGSNGIRYIGGNSLVIEHCRIWNFTNFGIDASKTSAGFLSVSETKIINCIAGGINATTTAGTMRVDIENTKAFGCTFGFKAGANTQFAAKSSSASGCGTAGFQADGATAVMNLDSCVATNNGNGVQSKNTATIRIGACNISNNITKGLDKTIGAGVIETYSDNYIRGNPASDAASPFGPS